MAELKVLPNQLMRANVSVFPVAGVELATFPFTNHEVDGRWFQRGPELVEVSVGYEYTLRPCHKALPGALLELGKLRAGHAVTRGVEDLDGIC